MPYKEGMTVEEGIQVVQQLNQLVEDDGVVADMQCDLSTQQDQPRKRAPPRCSGCGEIGHKTN